MITFQNEGLIDLQAVTTFGVSSKDNPESAIGFFGTGLKYAIAIILRNGGTITVYRGLDKYVFTAVKQTIRNDDFDIIHMNEQPLGFTTHLGVKWEPWQAYRELYCNMKDENGQVQARALGPKEGFTTIQVGRFPAFEDAHHSRKDIILESTPLFANHGVEVHAGENEWAYYRGVRALKLEYPSMFTYNILSAELSEDRTITSTYHNSLIGDAFATTEGLPERILNKILELNRETHEGHYVNFNYWISATDAFCEAARAIQRDPARLLRPDVQQLLIRKGKAEMPKSTLKLSTYQQLMLKGCVERAKLIGFDISLADIIFAEKLPGGALGMVQQERIYLSLRAFDRGATCLLGTLIEEHLHLVHGFHDESRPFQDFLIDKVATLADELHHTMRYTAA